MDLSSLNNTLPPALADAERDMGEKFRGAALNITTMYKSSLTYTKQAYQVGYSAALSDILNKVQSDIGSGEDAATALTRLMDWTEARQAAIKEFEAEDTDAPVAPRAQSVAASSSSFQRNTTPQRPSSAPIPEAKLRRDAPGPSSLRHDAMDADEPTPSSSRTPTARNPASATTILERSPAEASLAVPVPSSSPLPSPSNPRQIASQPLHTRQMNRVPSSSTVPTSSSFNFSLPTSISIPSLELPPASGPAQSGSIGSKRPIIEAEMTENNLATPVRGQGRHAAKRRSMGLGPQDGEEKERGNERRRGRRGGGGHAPSPL